MSEVEAYAKLADDLQSLFDMKAQVCAGMVDGGIMAFAVVFAVMFGALVGYVIGRTMEY